MGGRFLGILSVRAAMLSPVSAKGSRKNNFHIYPSRLQAIFARSEAAKSSKELAIPPVLPPPERTNLAQIRAPKMWKLFLREP